MSEPAEPASHPPLMEAAGYVLRIREPDWYEHRLFKGPDTNINLHVFSVACPEVDRVVLFRDWSLGHDEDRQLYERTKRELASRDWKYVQTYADAKSVVVAEVMARAEASSARQADDAAGERRSDSSSARQEAPNTGPFGSSAKPSSRGPASTGSNPSRSTSHK